MKFFELKPGQLFECVSVWEGKAPARGQPFSPVRGVKTKDGGYVSLYDGRVVPADKIGAVATGDVLELLHTNAWS
jgi:hypothetical protein